MSDTLVPCFVCGKTLKQVHGPMHPSGGVICYTPGNYGSRVFEPSWHDLDDRLGFIVCDACLVERADRVREVRQERIRPETTYTEWMAPADDEVLA